MSGLKGIRRPYRALLLVLFAGFLLPVSAQTQEIESVVIKAKGHGRIVSIVEDRKITSAIVVLRQNGTMLITVDAETLLQAEGTWRAAASSEEMVLKITGGAVEGDPTGSGKLLLTSDRKSIRELTVQLKSADGQQISVTFAGEASEAPK